MCWSKSNRRLQYEPRLQARPLVTQVPAHDVLRGSANVPCGIKRLETLVKRDRQATPCRIQIDLTIKQLAH